MAALHGHFRVMHERVVHDLLQVPSNHCSKDVLRALTAEASLLVEVAEWIPLDRHGNELVEPVGALGHVSIQPWQQRSIECSVP